MSVEIPLQLDVFTSELVDTRTQRQKQSDLRKDKPRQVEMFSQKAIAQFGVNAKPLIPLTPLSTLMLTNEDPRTPEEKEIDLQREAEEQTVQMFDEGTEQNHQ